MSYNQSIFQFGIEHEVSFVRPDGQFADYLNTTFTEFDAIVSQLPQYAQDYPQLRVGDAGIKLKRWYIEGFERFDLAGNVTDCPPKGIEIRTTVHDSIDGAVAELTESFALLRSEAMKAGFSPGLISFHPYEAEFVPVPPLNAYEQQRRQTCPEMQTAHIPMLTQGPDLNLSVAGLSPDELIDIGRKLTYYSPYVIPFSFSSPFYQGGLWSGLSARSFFRTGARPAAMVFLEKEEDLIDSVPSLTQLARVPAEVGRIEFKAFDSCGDFDLYAELLTLLKGLVLEQTLHGRATVPDAELHQQSAELGFSNQQIYQQAESILDAVSQVLNRKECDRISHLRKRLQQQTCPAKDMIAAYQTGKSITDILQAGYQQSTTRQMVSAS
ncbi:MAG: glutamate--cysteine ligase [Cyanobacteria bacterium J06607_10]